MANTSLPNPPHSFEQSANAIGHLLPQHKVVGQLRSQLKRERRSRLEAVLRGEKLNARLVSIEDHEQRLQKVGEMTAKFVHQLRTPLTTAMLYAGQLESQTDAQAAIAEHIVQGLDEINTMSADLLGYSAGSAPQHDTVNVEQLLGDIKSALGPQLHTDTELSISVTDEDLVVVANRFALKGALLNLVKNAEQSTADGARILLHGHRFSDRIHICVTDDGPGIPEHLQASIFEPFFTTRTNGTGLGLAVVKAMSESHGGSTRFSTSHLGTTFTVELPATQKAENQT